MEKMGNRQHKFTQIKPKLVSAKRTGIESKKGRRCDSKLDRRGTK
jgi:hypothetical protein